jgi:hypothetical protein
VNRHCATLACWGRGSQRGVRALGRASTGRRACCVRAALRDVASRFEAMLWAAAVSPAATRKSTCATNRQPPVRKRQPPCFSRYASAMPAKNVRSNDEHRCLNHDVVFTREAIREYQDILLGQRWLSDRAEDVSVARCITNSTGGVRVLLVCKRGRPQRSSRAGAAGWQSGARSLRGYP